MNLLYKEQLLPPEIIKLYKSGIRDFSGKKIFGDLTGADLSDSDFSNCDFWSVELTRANLRNTNFENANFKHTRIVNANLQKAILKNASFSRVDLSNTNLESANLRNIVIQGDFRNTLKGANLNKADLSQARFEGVDLSGISLKQATLQETVFWYVNLKDADLTEVNVRDSIFQGVFWLNTKIDNIEDLPEKELLSWQLVNQLIDDGDLQSIDLSEINLASANLEGINLSGVNLKRARLTGVNLANANLQGSNLHQAYLLGANLENANLNYANLALAHLAGVNLSNANLVNANLTQTKLNNANLFNTNLDNTNLSGASVFQAKLQKASNIPQNIISTYKTVTTNNPHKELVDAMKEASLGLNYPSEAFEPYEVFLWEQEFLGDLTLDKLLESTATLKLVDSDDFANSISAHNLNTAKQFSNFSQNIIEQANQLNNAFKSFIESINPYLTSVEFYQFETRAINDYSYIMPHIAMAQIKNGDWLAIGTLFENELHQECTKSAKQKIEINNLYEDEINQEIVEVLNNTVNTFNSLLPDLSISKSFHWGLANQREVALKNLLIDTKHFTIFDFDDFFALGISDSEDENYKRQTLHDLVTTNLEHLCVYRIGASNMDFYLLGQAKNKDWIGIRAEVTWT